MSMSNATENAFMELLFKATAWANYADNAAASPQTNHAVSLNTADPGEAGTMATSEATYTSYGRISVARSGAGWTVVGGTANPVATITFPTGTGGTGTATHFTVGKTGGGAAPYLFSGTITPPLSLGNTLTPKLTTATFISVD